MRAEHLNSDDTQTDFATHKGTNCIPSHEKSVVLQLDQTMSSLESVINSDRVNANINLDKWLKPDGIC